MCAARYLGTKIPSHEGRSGFQWRPMCAARYLGTKTRSNLHIFPPSAKKSMQAINIEDLRSRARRRLPKVIFEFIDGGAQDETTLRANREDFQKWRFRTRVLTDVSKRDQSITLFGQRCSSPLILAPTGLAGLLSRRGELAAARAAEKFGVPYCLSTMATCSIEEITTD